MDSIKKILLLYKKDNSPALETGRSIAFRLEQLNVEVSLSDADIESGLLRSLAAKHDAILVLGGDGTMLGVARRLGAVPTPVLGMNFGRVGFLNELPPEGWQKPLEELAAGKWFLERHMVLCWRILKKQKNEFCTWAEGIAVNDVVTAHGAVARTVSLALRINGIDFTSLRGDGIIVGTPLGSTAYTASAGGPLALPSLNTMLLTPICPFSGGFSPLVLPSSSKICLESCRQGSDVIVSIDGQEDYTLAYGDILEITGMTNGLHMLVSDSNWYLRRLISRGIIAPGPGKKQLQ